MKESDIKEAEESPPEPDEAEESHGVIVVVAANITAFVTVTVTVSVAVAPQMAVLAHNAPVAQSVVFSVSNAVIKVPVAGHPFNFSVMHVWYVPNATQLLPEAV